MHYLKKSIACLVALAFMPSPKAAAAEWSYGIKVGGATSFQHRTDEQKKRAIGEHQKQLGKDVAVNFSSWNPWFGAALYMECAFNNHIGLGTELLYNRFGRLMKVAWDEIDGKKQRIGVRSIHTIGLPVLLIWSWTGAIRPDFKADYFLGRSFVDFHPFLCISYRQQTTDKNGKKLRGYIKVL